MTVKRIVLEEQVVPDKRLGRHVEHDPRSRDHAYGAVVRSGILKEKHHRRFGDTFTQGEGSCTGQASAGVVNTMPVRKGRSHKPLLKVADAVDLYKLATSIDEFPGTFPPDDTGSSGLAVAKAAVQKGYISAYKHAFGIEEAVTALQFAPVITGVNWYEGFDTPNVNGKVEISGQVRGGHEFEVLGFVPGKTFASGIVIAENSWGAGWGKKGRFSFTVSTWGQLLDEEGDVTILLR